MIFILVVNFIIASITAQSHVFLPDAPPNNFEIFSGYFTVNVNNINDEKIHYMLVFFVIFIAILLIKSS